MRFYAKAFKSLCIPGMRVIHDHLSGSIEANLTWVRCALAPAAAGCKDPGLGKYLGRQFFVSAITVWRPLTRNLGRARIQEFAIGCLSAELRCAPSRSYFDKNLIWLICRMWPICKWIIVTRSLPRWPGSSSLDSSSLGVPTKGFH